MLPLWVYGAVALVIALLAFGVGQIVPGMGVAFVALATTMWTVSSVGRQRRLGAR